MGKAIDWIRNHKKVVVGIIGVGLYLSYVWCASAHISHLKSLMDTASVVVSIQQI